MAEVDISTDWSGRYCVVLSFEEKPTESKPRKVVFQPGSSTAVSLFIAPNVRLPDKENDDPFLNVAVLIVVDGSGVTRNSVLPSETALPFESRSWKPIWILY